MRRRKNLSELENRDRFAFRGTHIGGDDIRYKVWEALGDTHAAELSGKFFLERLNSDDTTTIRKEGPLFDTRLAAIEAIKAVAPGHWPGE
jgi:hypothetical protein